MNRTINQDIRTAPGKMQLSLALAITAISLFIPQHASDVHAVEPNLGALNSITIVESGSQNLPPVAGFSYSKVGDIYTFDATGTNDPDGTIATYSWQFSDGTTAIASKVTHSFAALPAQATLTVTDNAGGVAILQKTINIEQYEAILDDADPGAFAIVGTWSNSTFTPGYYGPGYKTAPNGTGDQTATWVFLLPVKGLYEIFIYYTAASNRATNAPIIITNSGATISKVTINQRINGETFFSLGKYSLAAGELRVTLTNGGDGYSIADAVKVILIQ